MSVNVSVHMTVVVVVWFESMMIHRHRMLSWKLFAWRIESVVQVVVVVVMQAVPMLVPKGRIFSRILASSSVFQDPDQTGEV